MVEIVGKVAGKIKDFDLKRLKNLLGVEFIVLAALIIFAIVIFFRNNFYFPFFENDGARDYLIANHIVKYGETPLVGPWAGTIQGLTNTPVYFYILAAFLFIRNDPTFLVFVVTALHTISAVFIYLLGKKVSNKFLAFLAAAFFILFLSSVRKTYGNYVWQPWVMLPFVNLSLLLLLTSFLKKSIRILFFAVAILLFSASIHNSAYAVLPLFLVISLLLLRSQRVKPIKYLQVLGLIACLPLLLYLPVLFSAFLSKTNLLATSAHINMTVQTYYLGFLNNISNLIKGITYFSSFDQIVHIVIVVAVFIILTLVLYLNRKDQWRRIFIASAGLFILQQLVISSFFTNISFVQLAPIWGLFILTVFVSLGYLCGSLVGEVRSSKVSGAVLTATLSILFILTLLGARLESKRFDFISNINKPDLLEKVLGTPVELKNKNLMEGYYRSGYFGAVKSIESEVLQIKENNGLKNLKFFQIRSYFESNQWNEPIFWANLEKDLEEKFIEISKSAFSFRQTNSNEYIFLICFGDANDESKTTKDCQKTFSDENKNYALVKKVFSKKPVPVYEMYESKYEPAIVYLSKKRT